MATFWCARLAFPLLALLAPSAAQAQHTRPPFATTLVSGTENVYIFRNGNHQALDWDRLILGRSGPGDRLGTKQEVQDQLEPLRTASAERQALARQDWLPAEKEFKLLKYQD